MIRHNYSASTVEGATAVSQRAVLARKGRATSRLDCRDQVHGFQGRGGISQENRSYGFLPAFLDHKTGTVYLSRFADGRLAPMHLLEGLPLELVLREADSQRVLAIKDSVTAGFSRNGRFYSRQEAVQAVSEWMPHRI